MTWKPPASDLPSPVADEGSMTILTEEMILVKTRCKDLERVRNLNMFGSDLEDVGILKVAECHPEHDHCWTSSHPCT